MDVRPLEAKLERLLELFYDEFDTLPPTYQRRLTDEIINTEVEYKRLTGEYYYYTPERNI